jgi:pimeloyl-ACP methyl ester carboxylesterase
MWRMTDLDEPLYSQSWGSAGDAPQALLLHGLTSSHRVWWQVAEGLAAAGWSVTAVDLRGHGQSPRADSYLFDDLADDVLALGGAPWDLLVGHSLGGAIAVNALERNPGFARRTVLLDPAIRNDPARLPAFVAATMALIAHPDAAAMRAGHPNWPDRTIEAWLESLREVDPDAVRAILETNRPWDVTATALRVTSPVHVLAADPELSPSFTIAEGEQFRAANPNWSYEVVPGAGHSIHRDAPDLVIARLASTPVDSVSPSLPTTG